MGTMIIWEPKNNKQRCDSEEEAMTKIRRVVPDAEPDLDWTQAPGGTTSVKNVWRIHRGRTVKVASVVDAAMVVPQPETKICPPSDLPL
jgi:hypothetical protein